MTIKIIKGKLRKILESRKKREWKKKKKNKKRYRISCKSDGDK